MNIEAGGLAATHECATKRILLVQPPVARKCIGSMPIAPRRHSDLA